MNAALPRTLALAAALLGASALGACGSGSSVSGPRGSGGNAADQAGWAVTTPAASSDVSGVNWGLIYEPATLDPIHSADYPASEVLANLCDGLQRETPDFGIGNGLAKASNPSPTTWVYNVNPRAAFWDGSPVTAEDVRYSLQRNLDPKLGSYWSFYFRHVKRVVASGPHQVTVTLTKPDVLFNQGMSTTAGAIIEKRYAERAGGKYGTSSGGVMCSGPFRFSSWKPGSSIEVVRNDRYWDASLRPKVGSVTFKFLPGDNAMVNALSSGEIDGTYHVPFSAIDRLRSSGAGDLYLGKSLIQVDLIGTSKTGPFADVNVRNALSKALDRAALARVIFSNAATPARTMVSHDNYGYAKDVFDTAWNSLGAPAVDVPGAQALAAKATSKAPIVLAYPTGSSSYYDQLAVQVQRAAESVGLSVKLKGMPLDTYKSLATDDKLRKGIDLSINPWYIDIAEPLVQYEQFVPGASVWNQSGYSSPEVTRLVNTARQESDPTKRAGYLVEAQKSFTRDMPWVPVVQVANTLFMSKRITGAPASFVQLYYPWAAMLGGK